MQSHFVRNIAPLIGNNNCQNCPTSVIHTMIRVHKPNTTRRRNVPLAVCSVPLGVPCVRVCALLVIGIAGGSGVSASSFYLSLFLLRVIMYDMIVVPDLFIYFVMLNIQIHCRYHIIKGLPFRPMLCSEVRGSCRDAHQKKMVD